MNNTLLRLKYAGLLIVSILLFWEPLVYSHITYQDWRYAIRYCWHIMRTGDVWSAP